MQEVLLRQQKHDKDERSFGTQFTQAADGYLSEFGKSQTAVLQWTTWFPTDFWQSSSLLPFSSHIIVHSHFCPMPAATMLHAASVRFQVARAWFLLAVGGLGLCHSFQGLGHHFQGTWHHSCKWKQRWMAAERPWQELFCQSSSLHASLAREAAVLMEGWKKSIQEIFFKFFWRLPFYKKAWETKWSSVEWQHIQHLAASWRTTKAY